MIRKLPGISKRILKASFENENSYRANPEERVAMNGQTRGRLAVVEAKGTSLEALGLVAFLLTTYSLIKNHSLVLTLSLAIVAWTVVSVLLWFFVKRVLKRRRG
jgi:hypothetical protein